MKQTSISQRVSSNKNNEGSKPPVPLPQSTVPKNKPSLICQSPNGGYVSLLRQTISKLGNADNDCSTVQFNSLQRPNRGIIATSQHRERVQFRSMRTVSSSSKNDTRKTADYRRSFIAAIGHDKNNNYGNGKKLTNIDSDNYCEDKTMPVESRKCNEKQNVGNDERKDVIGSLTSKSFPKPAPRTRVPSGTVGPSLAHHETYENLQNLLKNDDDIDKKVCSDKLYRPFVAAVFYSIRVLLIILRIAYKALHSHAYRTRRFTLVLFDFRTRWT